MLVVMADTPFPARKNGISVRYYPLLKRLARGVDVHLLCFVHDAGQVEIPGDLRACLKSFDVLVRSGRKPPLLQKLFVQLRRILPFGMPYFLYEYDASETAGRLAPWLRQPHDVLLWVFSSHVLQCAVPHVGSKKIFIDAIDSLTLHVSRRVSPVPFLSRVRAWKTRVWECSLLRQSDRCFVVSPVDAAVIRQGLPTVPLEVLPNGILTEDLGEGHVQLPTPSIGFLGNMTYGPNVDAVRRLVRIYRRLKPHFPSLVLYVIGRESSASALAMPVEKDIIFSGTVDNIWPHVNAVDIFAFPMAQGGGQQNKLLEVMAVGKPVVCTTVANGGIQAKPRESVEIADDEQEFAASLALLLADPDRRDELGKAGRDFVRTHYDWDRLAARLAELATT